MENLSNLNARAPARGPTRVAWRLFNRSLYRYFLQVRKAQFKPSAAGTTIYYNCYKTLIFVMIYILLLTAAILLCINILLLQNEGFLDQDI